MKAEDKAVVVAGYERRQHHFFMDKLLLLGLTFRMRLQDGGCLVVALHGGGCGGVCEAGGVPGFVP